MPRGGELVDRPVRIDASDWPELAPRILELKEAAEQKLIKGAWTTVEEAKRIIGQIEAYDAVIYEIRKLQRVKDDL